MQQWVSINNACDIDESTLTETKSNKRRLFPALEDRIPVTVIR